MQKGQLEPSRLRAGPDDLTGDPDAASALQTIELERARRVRPDDQRPHAGWKRENMSLLVIGPGVHIHLCRGQAGTGVCAGAVIRPCGNIGRKGVAAAHRAGIAAGIGRRYRHIEHRTARAAGLTCSAPRDVGTRADWQAIVKGSGECQASGDRDGRMQNGRLRQVRVGR